MQWLLLCLCVSAAASMELRCEHPHCTVANQEHSDYLKFYVESTTVEVKYTESHFHVNCHRTNALDASALPHFTSEFLASSVILEECPMPTSIGNGSLVKAIAAFNVKLQLTNDEISIQFLNFPWESLFFQHQFLGLENLTNLSIKNNKLMRIRERYLLIDVPLGFFTKFQNLRVLELKGVRLPDGELYRLPQSLREIDIDQEHTELLPNTLSEAFSVTSLVLPHLLVFSLHLCKRSSPTNNTNMINLENTNIQQLSLHNWLEKKLKALRQCQNLRSFKFSDSQSLKELPRRMVAECMYIEVLEISSLPNLKRLPAKLLEGATSLKQLKLRYCAHWLPDDFFEGTPNLIELDLSDNWLKMFASDTFLGLPVLKSLSLRHNRLEDDDLESLAPLTSLTELDLSENQLRNLCDDGGYSPLVNLTQLKTLDLSDIYGTQVCRDWRENMPILENFKTKSISIKELTLADFHYVRDESIKNFTVNMSFAFSPEIRFTENDYKNALTAPATAATLNFTPELWNIIECNCNTYWLRKALDDASQAIKIKHLYCHNNPIKRLFEDIPPEEMCPERVSSEV